MAGRITRSTRAALDPGEIIGHLAAPNQTVEHAPGTRHGAPGAAAHCRTTVPGEGLGEHGFHNPDEDEDMITPTRHDGGKDRP